MSTEQQIEPCMGTRAEAEAGLLTAWGRYCETRQPRMVPKGRKAAEKRHAEAHEAVNQMAQAGALLAWHIDREKRHVD